jgi:hypothetical protein
MDITSPISYEMGLFYWGEIRSKKPHQLHSCASGYNLTGGYAAKRKHVN